MSSASQILIIESRYYEDVAEMLLKGAKAALEKEGMQYDVITVPGALEIPQAVKIKAGEYHGFVALGCVIRGETSHYDVVAGESARALMDLSIRDGLIIGNGILTCENLDQAIVRADPEQKNKGADAAQAVLSLVALKGA